MQTFFQVHSASLCRRSSYTSSFHPLPCISGLSPHYSNHTAPHLYPSISCTVHSAHFSISAVTPSTPRESPFLILPIALRTSLTRMEPHLSLSTFTSTTVSPFVLHRDLRIRSLD